MGKCEVCGTDIDDRYKFCLKCAREMKETNKEVGAVKDVSSDEIVKALGAVNNNLYALRTIQEAILERSFGLSLRWDKDNAKFVIEKTQKKARK